jgi:methionine-gamma-lyase
VKEFRTFLGGMLDPHSAWMLARSMETLHVRVERQQDNAGHLLAHLRELCGPEAIRSAWKEDLSAMGEDISIAEEQQRGGGSMIGLTVPGGREGAFAFLDALTVFKLAVSLGSTESLAEHPASMTHAGVPAEAKVRMGITEGFVRLSVGLEHPEDLKEDVTQAWKVACEVANLPV